MRKATYHAWTQTVCWRRSSGNASELAWTAGIGRPRTWCLTRWLPCCPCLASVHISRADPTTNHNWFSFLTHAEDNRAAVLKWFCSRSKLSFPQKVSVHTPQLLENEYKENDRWPGRPPSKQAGAAGLSLFIMQLLQINVLFFLVAYN